MEVGEGGQREGVGQWTGGLKEVENCREKLVSDCGDES